MHFGDEGAVGNMFKAILFSFFQQPNHPIRIVYFFIAWFVGNRVGENMWAARYKVLLPFLLLSYSSLAHAERNGIALDMSYMGEGVSNVSGGLKKGSAYLGTADISVMIDTEQAGWWQDGTWFVETLVNHGTNPSSFIGDTQTASNIADGNRTRLQQFWYQHQVNDNVSVLFGLHDLNSEFYVSEYGSLFLNSSFGIGPDITANVPTSLWPEAGYAARLDVHGEHLYLHIAAYDGNPSTRRIDSATEGMMWISETAYVQGASAYKLGVWQHTADKTAVDGTVYGSDSGAYAVVDQAFSDSVGMFMQLGFAPSDRNEISQYVGLGLHMHGLIPSRYHDTFGIAMAHAAFSGLNRSINQLAAAETTVEITYDAPINEHISLHPALQWIQHPGGQSALSPAKVAMLRVEMHLP